MTLKRRSLLRRRLGNGRHRRSNTAPAASGRCARGAHPRRHSRRHRQLRPAPVLVRQRGADQEPLRQPARVHARREGSAEPRNGIPDRARQQVGDADVAPGRQVPFRQPVQRRGGRRQPQEGRRSEARQERVPHHVLRAGLDGGRRQHHPAELQGPGARTAGDRPAAVHHHHRSGRHRHGRAEAGGHGRLHAG